MFPVIVRSQAKILLYVTVTFLKKKDNRKHQTSSMLLRWARKALKYLIELCKVTNNCFIRRHNVFHNQGIPWNSQKLKQRMCHCVPVIKAWNFALVLKPIAQKALNTTKYATGILKFKMLNILALVSQSVRVSSWYKKNKSMCVYSL